jgi:uncharacterized protein (TIGR02598 family)
MKNSVSPKLRARRAGFTLAEVMIAMGIVASVMVALLGMIPLGVRSVREASNITICGRIAQEVISNIQQANWGAIESSFDKKTFYFDHEGFLMAGAGGGNGGGSGRGRDTTPSYEARILFTNTENIEFGTTKYPKSTLRKVLIDVEYTPDGIKIPVKPAQMKNGNPNIHSYNFYVANQNKSAS